MPQNHLYQDQIWLLLKHLVSRRTWHTVITGAWHPSQEIYDEWFNEENSTHPTNPDPDGSPDGSVPFEYIISCIDVYYGPP